MQQGSVTWCLYLAALLVVARVVVSVTPLDQLKVTQKYSKRLTSEQLRRTLQVSSGLLCRHNQLDSPVQQYVSQVNQTLQQDCCDYFTAVALIRNLTHSLLVVLDLRLPNQLYPAIRRSYVAAIWLLQRSRLFRWDTKYMQKLSMSGFCRLYQAHIDISAGRPISFHHISKSGGTSLCKIAQANGCKGPTMNRAQNCILDTGLDGPIWVLQHDVLADNHIPADPPPPSPSPPPPPPPPPPLRAPDLDEYAEGDVDHGEYIVDELFDHRPAAQLPVVPVEVMQWFMYNCTKVLAQKAAYGCMERQEAAMAKSATFFANEHALSTQHGTPQVCSSFTNMVMMREPLSEVVSLMGEVTQVYTRLLRRHTVDTWQPPRWDLSWWQQRAPVVISSYSSRTLLGAAAFCPGHSVDHVGSCGGSSWLCLGEADTQTALEQLYTFDIVLELGSPDLIDMSVSKLLGWSGQMFSSRPRERRTPEAKVLTWEQLQHLALQEPPAVITAAPGNQQQYSAAAAAAAAASKDLDLDATKRMIAEARVRKTYSDHGVQYIVTPLSPGHKPAQAPPTKARAAAVEVLQRVNQSTVELVIKNGAASHIEVRLQGLDAVMPSLQEDVALISSRAAAAAAAQSSNTATRAGAANSQDLYHIWPRHGVVLDDEQFQRLLQFTAADQKLHEHAQVLQLLDAAWLNALEHSKCTEMDRKLLDERNKVPATVQWEQQLSFSFADVAEGQPLQLTPFPSIQQAGSLPLLSGLEHIFDSDSEDDDLQPWMQMPVKQYSRQLPIQTIPVKQLQPTQPIQPLSNSSLSMGKSNTATSAADAGAAVARLKQKQSLSANDHMRSYLAQLSDVQSTLREKAALAATLADVAANTSKAQGGVDSLNSSDEDDGDSDMEEDEEDYGIRPAKRRNTLNKHSPQRRPGSQHNNTKLPAAAGPQPFIATSASAAAGHLMTPGAVLQAAPISAPAPAADDGFEATLQYLAQLSDVQATLHQNATLAATLHGHSAPSHQQGDSSSPRAAVAAAAAVGNPSSLSGPGRKRNRSADQGGKLNSAAVVTAGAGAAGSAGHVTGLQQAPATLTWTTAAQDPGAAVPQSSFRGVEYLPAEGRWQAYMYDRSLGEVVFLEKYEHELDAALAHDREMVRRLGAAAAADHINFSNSIASGSSKAVTAVTAALTMQPPVAQSAAGTTGAQSSGGKGAAIPAAAADSSVSEQRQFAAAAAWAAAHAAQASAAMPESRYKGVEYLPAEARWQAYMLDTTVNQVVWLDKFSDELSAAEAHDAAVISKLGAPAAVAAGQVNFPDKVPAAALQQPQQQHEDQQGLAVPKLSIAPLQLHGTAPGSNDAAVIISPAAGLPGAVGTGSPTGKGRGGRAGRGAGRATRETKPISQYKGVSWSSSCHKWAAVIWDRASKKARHVGVYSSEEEAARAYDREVIATQGAKNTGLNFRDSVDRYRAEVGEPPAAADSGAAAAKPNSSEYRGVSWHERSKRWEARAWGGGRQHFVGSFSSAMEAARAYDKAILKLGGAGPKSASRLNFPLTDYDLGEIAAMNFPQSHSTKRPPPVKRGRKQAAAVESDSLSDDE